MPILINVSGLSKAFSARPLFEAVTFAIETRERIGLIGPNGAGKSTLLRILSGQMQPDGGKISFQRGIRIGYLEQVPTFSANATVESSVLEGTSDSQEWESLAKAREVMSKLDLNDPSTLIQNLSGGWKKRVALARELARSPDVLLLDEPTNHLDLDSILWLEDFLTQAPFATVVITHDRFFLQKISNRILELDKRNPGGLLSIKGDYTHYLESKELLISAQEQREVVLKNTLRRETEWLRQGAKARTTKQQARIQRAETLKNDVSELEYRNQSKKVLLDFQSSEKNPKKLVELKNVSKGFQLQTIFSNLDLQICPGNRFGILGHNGCGKSTLVRTILGLEPPDSGTVTRSDNLSVAYFEQNREALDPTVSVAKTICPQGEYVSYRGSQVHIRSYLNRFLFNQGQMEMAVGKLSGGEQSRLFMAKLMLEEANLLVLDEPTNDLDLATLRVLEECLVDFPGAILLVTHDRYFLGQVATQILAFAPHGSDEKRIHGFSTFSQWETWYQSQLKALRAATQIAAPSTSSNSGSSKKKKLSFKDQRELDGMEETIQKAEKSLAELSEASLLPANASNSIKLTEISKQMHELQDQINDLYVRWGELEQR